LETQTLTSIKEISNSIAWESDTNIVFFYTKGIILQHWPPWKQTLNGTYYANTLKNHLREGNRKKKTGYRTKQWFLLREDGRRILHMRQRRR
jgi:hypothetical protein